MHHQCHNYKLSHELGFSKLLPNLQREPEQVFRLLEALYQSFDEAGEKLRIFKGTTFGE